ncbi:hypothetical protein MO973_42780 [Paenibacillus sp. TRM 82003]|nr:hypothetical protein [Paenibacillus sp. TRM 82003]
MKNQGNSMQSQNPLSQAQQSLDHVHNAVAMAQSHPTEQMIENAERSIEKAQRSIEQMDGGEPDNPGAIQLAKEELQEEQSNLGSLR